MSNGQLQRISGAYHRADAQLASRLPDLRLPRMNEAARAAFRAVLDCERPPGNGSLMDFLALAEARGFCGHPADWVPAFDDDPYLPPLYQPWVDWLSEHGLTRFHDGNWLTEDNWDRWKPRPRLRAFRKLLRETPQAAADLLMTMAPSQPAAIRLALLGEIDAGGAFYGNYPRQVPMLRFFLADPSARIRAAAEEKLARMNGLQTEAAHAAELARHIEVSGGRVTYGTPPAPHTSPWSVQYSCTTFDHLAAALGLSPRDLARQADLEGLGSNFLSLLVGTGDVESRAIVAARMLEAFPPDQIPIRLFRGVERPLWERGLRAFFRSEYSGSVEEFLGPEIGTLSPAQMPQLLFYERLDQSVINELEAGTLPVNIRYDPLRALGLVLRKDAAQEALNRAVSLGMKADSPRLTMLKFNMAL